MCFPCLGGKPRDRQREGAYVAPPPAAQKASVKAASPIASAPARPAPPPVPHYAPTPALPPVVLQLQRQLAALQGTWISRVDTALKLTMECTGASAVSLSMLSQAHDCLVVLARRGPQHLVLPPGSCIAIADPATCAQSLDDPGQQHALQYMYSSAAAIVRTVPPPHLQQPRTSAAAAAAAANGAPTSGSVAAAAAAAAPDPTSLPLDWAHLSTSAGITHFAALPLYHGAQLAGALTLLGCAHDAPPTADRSVGGLPSNPGGGAAASASTIPSGPGTGTGGAGTGTGTGTAATSAAVSGTGVSAHLAVAAAATAGASAPSPASPSSLDALFAAPMCLELVAMAVAQCCLGADMALARLAVEMVQAMHACASIQQLVAAVSLGLQSLMAARFCLTLRCNVALAVEFQPNAIMFEEMGGGAATGLPSAAGGAAGGGAHAGGGGGGGSVSGSQAGALAQGMAAWGAPAHEVPGKPPAGGLPGRSSTAAAAAAAASSPGPDGKRDAPGRTGSRDLAGGQPAAGGGGGGGVLVTALSRGRSGFDTGEPGWHMSSNAGLTSASMLLHQIVGRRYKARPFSVYHTLLIRTIHELATSSYGGTVITHCHDHMQDAKTPSRDIYALGRGVGQPPQSLILSVTHLRPADDVVCGGGAAAAAGDRDSGGGGGGGACSGTMVVAHRHANLSHRSHNGSRPVLPAAAATTAASSSDAAVTALSGHDHVSSSVGPGSASANAALLAAAAESGAATGGVSSSGGGGGGGGGGAHAGPRTYMSLYVTSTEPLPRALLELILVEVHSLAAHVLSPLVHRKLLVGELAVEWSLMQTVTSSSLAHGGCGGTDSAGRIGQRNASAANSAAASTAAAVMGGSTAAANASRTAHAGGGSEAAAGPGGLGLGASTASNASLLVGPPGVAVDGSTADGGGAAVTAALAARQAGSHAPSAAASRLSSLQRVMQPFLMADMVVGDHAGGGAGGAGSGVGIFAGSGAGASRRSGEVPFGSGAGLTSPPVGARAGSTGQQQPIAAASPGGAGGGAAGIRRVLAFGPDAVGGGAASGPARTRNSSISASEGVAREMLLAAASAPGGAVGGGGGGESRYLSTEVASVQDTHSQMGLLVVSYKETLHSMHMELATGAVKRRSPDLNADDPGKLVLREVLGKGGHGVVFRGTMHSLEVAIKVFQTPGEDEPLAAGTASRPEVLAETLLQRRRVLTRAALELAVMASISHPNIVQVYAQWPSALLERDETQPCRRRLRKLPPDTAPPPTGGLVCAVMVMEYCDKGTLVDAINRGDFVSPSRDGAGLKPHFRAIYTTLLEVALALRHLASMAVTHCDVKPANILLRASPRDPRGFTAKLADFGYAALLRDASPDGHRSVVTDEACGTVTHMAPECFVEGEPVDSSADVYAFGILMWELISGKQPYHDRNLKQLPHEVVNKGLRPTFPPNTPDVYKALAKTCWSPLPRNRPTAAQVVQSVQAQLDKIEAVARLLGGKA